MRLQIKLYENVCKKGACMSRKLKGASESEYENNGGDIKVTKGKNPQLFEEPPAYVSFSTGYTINLGNYESKKIEIGITRPCVNADKAIDKTFKGLVKDVEAKIKSKTESTPEPKGREAVALQFLDK
jgi:hypothetical protein